MSVPALFVRCSAAVVMGCSMVSAALAATPPDRAAKPQVGKASIYAKKFAGRKMANGRPMDPRRDIAASKTLPLGSKAVVTNLDTGKSAVVTIEDRGPYVAGRVVDLSPSTAEKIGLSHEAGVAPVQVKPIQRAPDAGKGAHE